jgi:hypothetical protein
LTVDVAQDSGQFSIGKLADMIPITNPKVASLEPTCARFVGFSLLFDSPGASLRPDGRFEVVHCESELGLYRELSQFAVRLLDSDLGICLLPPHSYHVTVFDGGNQANVGDARPEFKDSLSALLLGLPDSWNEHHELVAPDVQFAREQGDSLNIELKVSQLRLWGNQVLVAGLEPIDEQSQAIFNQLVEARAILSNTYRTTYGFGAGPKFGPHISLAYFANESGGESASAKLDEWNEELRHRTKGLSIQFNSIRAYAFTDMATFYRSRNAASSGPAN